MDSFTGRTDHILSGSDRLGVLYINRLSVMIHRFHTLPLHPDDSICSLIAVIPKNKTVIVHRDITEAETVSCCCGSGDPVKHQDPVVQHLILCQGFFFKDGMDDPVYNGPVYRADRPVLADQGFLMGLKPILGGDPKQVIQADPQNVTYGRAG